jgi:hypothetical protein
VKKLFAFVISLVLVAVIRMGTTGCGKKDEKPKGGTPPAADSTKKDKPAAP